MRYRLLGRTGLRASEVCLGAMVFGDERGPSGATREECDRIVERFGNEGGWTKPAPREPGSPHDFDVAHLMYGKTEALIDDHRQP